MSLAAILKEAGFVPAVPATSRSPGTPESKAQSHVPIVPPVPAQKCKGPNDHEAIRAHLLKLADAESIDPELIHRLTAADLDSSAGLPVETLRAYVRALRDSDLRERGKVPADETARALCHSCGPIWIAPEVAAVAPVVDGWPRLLGCPWCHIKDRQLIPRPPVARSKATVPDVQSNLRELLAK